MVAIISFNALGKNVVQRTLLKYVVQGTLLKYVGLGLRVGTKVRVRARLM